MLFNKIKQQLERFYYWILRVGWNMIVREEDRETREYMFKLYNRWFPHMVRRVD